MIKFDRFYAPEIIIIVIIISAALFSSTELLAHMSPYLQTPTPNSIYVCWHSADSTEPMVEYGTTPALGFSQTGDYHFFDEAGYNLELCKTDKP